MPFFFEPMSKNSKNCNLIGLNHFCQDPAGPGSLHACGGWGLARETSLGSVATRLLRHPRAHRLVGVSACTGGHACIGYNIATVQQSVLSAHRTGYVFFRTLVGHRIKNYIMLVRRGY